MFCYPRFCYTTDFCSLFLFLRFGVLLPIFIKIFFPLPGEECFPPTFVWHLFVVPLCKIVMESTIGVKLNWKVCYDRAKLNVFVVKGRQCSYFAKGAPGSSRMPVWSVCPCACKSDYLEHFDIDGWCRFVYDICLVYFSTVLSRLMVSQHLWRQILFAQEITHKV